MIFLFIYLCYLILQKQIYIYCSYNKALKGENGKLLILLSPQMWVHAFRVTSGDVILELVCLSRCTSYYLSWLPLPLPSTTSCSPGMSCCLLCLCPFYMFFLYYWITFLHNFWLSNSCSFFKTHIKHHLPCDVFPTPPRYSCSLFWILTFCLFVCFVYASS